MNKLLCLVLFLISPVVSGFSQKVTINNGHFYSVYDLGVRCPQQVEWAVTPSDLGDVDREPSWRFVQDIKHPLAIGSHEDYSQSGYDRGHMCPAQDRSSDKLAMRSTFVMSNIAPQIPSMNRGSWKKTEILCRNAAMLYDSVQVLAMPVFLNRDTTFIGRHKLGVPHAFFKVAWLPKNDSVIGLWWFWNK